jgi:hypothetical protein
MCTLTEPVNWTYELYWTSEPLESTLLNQHKRTFTPQLNDVTYKLLGSARKLWGAALQGFILLDGIRTQDLVSWVESLLGHLFFHAVTVALLEFTLKWFL